MSNYDKFIGTVVDVKDPELSGRVKVRVYGDHDNSNTLPDSDLTWFRCVFPVTNAVHNGVSAPTTGLVVGSTVTGFFLDDLHQIGIVDGTLGRGSIETTEDTPNRSDFPSANIGRDYNDVLKTNVYSSVVGNLKSHQSQTIGDVQYIGQNINTMLNDLNSHNISGAIGAIKDSLNSFNALKAQLTNTELDVTNIINSYANNAAITAIFDTSSFSAGSVSDRLAKQPITTSVDALNRVNGSNFVMGNTMKDIESAFSKIKQFAKTKNINV